MRLDDGSYFIHKGVGDTDDNLWKLKEGQIGDRCECHVNVIFI